MPIMTLPELISVLPGAQEGIATGALKEGDLVESALKLNAQLPGSGEDASQAASELRLRLPGTRYTIAIGSSSLALLRLGWSAYKLHTGHADFSDAINLPAAVDQLVSAVEHLSEEDGEFCLYLAVGSVGSLTDLFTGHYPTTAMITSVLRERGGDWCGLTCRFHSLDHPPFDVEQVAGAMDRLEAKKVVSRKGRMVGGFGFKRTNCRAPRTPRESPTAFLARTRF